MEPEAREPAARKPTVTTVDDVAEAAATLFVAEAEQSVAARGRFVVALSGGSTPLKMYARLSETHADAAFWAHTLIFWGDERYVAHDDPESNYGAAKTALLDRVNVSSRHINPWPFLGDAPEQAAAQYADRLTRVLGEAPFDLTLLGLGDDAHTASLFPGTGAVRATGLTTVVRPQGKGVRLSLSAGMLSRSRVVAFLVSGEGKRAALEATLKPDSAPDLDRTPARAVYAQEKLMWLTDVAL